MSNKSLELSRYESKIRRINIELPNYKFFHSPSQIKLNDHRFIGRKESIERLKNILIKNESKSGAYLVTGYRGMGKSSFVNKVLSLITFRSLSNLYQLLIVTLITIFLSFIFKWFFVVPFWGIYFYLFHFHFIISITDTIGARWLYIIQKGSIERRKNILIKTESKSRAYLKSIRYNITDIIMVICKLKIEFLGYIWRQLKNFLKLIKNKLYLQELVNRRKRIVLSLNLGHEILNEKDILSLVSKNVEKEFRNFAYNPIKQLPFYFIKLITIFFLTSQIVKTDPIPQSIYSNILLTQSSGFKGKFKPKKSSTDKTFLFFRNNARSVDYVTPEINSIIITYQSEQIGKNYLFYARHGHHGKYNLFPSWINSLDETRNKTISENYFSLIQGIKGKYEPSTIKSLLIKGVNMIDAYLDWGYCAVSTKIKRCLHINSEGFPTHLNYFFLFIFLFLSLFLSMLFRFILECGYLPFTSRKVILKKLNALNEHIDASIRTETSIGMNSRENTGGINANHKKSKEYPIANIRQIEKSLTDIFDEMDKLVVPILRPLFIIVFDELDKIDPDLNSSISDKESELFEFDSSSNGFPGGTATRERKENVLKLLANMKYFITTAKAKFIFISGRELYDAFLADVADREFSISSIFHEVIYVESFLSDASDNNKSDITSMTEHYICQFLMPEWFIKYKTIQKANQYDALTLKSYRDYLEGHYPRFLKKRKNDNEDEEEMKLIIDKTIMLLYQFVHYVTHVSNGAPKKITNLFERYIVSVDPQKKYDSVFIKSIYLSFSYMDQCKIGFIHYLANPIMMAITNNVRNYGDKLLISASFLIDHIYKFHNNGFSWRNLEHAPEILDINRTPELRNFISIIISYLTQIHISPVIAGLYVFKFPQKISEEISYISKMSEEASAIFNFTLDESLSVKRYYLKLLKYYTKQYHDEKLRKLQSDEYIHTIADIHHILGDLHLADEEYSEAIFEYLSCVQYISHNFKGENDGHQATHLLFVVRTMLKLGLVYEKRKTYNSAYLAYSELVSQAIDFRYVDEKSFGLQYKIDKQEGWNGQKAVLYKSDFVSWDDEEPFTKETMPQELDELDKAHMTYIARGEELIPTFAKITTPLKNKLITRLSLFEDIRLMYQAILAKLFVLEKQHLGGISLANLKVAEGEFLNLHLATNLKDKFLISADFFKKLGDIMFYKNGLVNQDCLNLFAGLYFWDYDVNNDVDNYQVDARERENLKSLIKKIPSSKIKEINYFGTNLKSFLNDYVRKQQLMLNDNAEPIIPKSILMRRNVPKETTLQFITEIKQMSNFISEKNSAFSPPKIESRIFEKIIACNERRTKFLESKTSTPCFACKYYNRSLKILAGNLLNQTESDSPQSKALIFLKAFDENNKFYSNRNNFGQILASTLGGFGDVLVSCSNNEDNIDDKFLIAFFDYIKSNNKDDIHYKNLASQCTNLSPLEKALLYYLASAKYYKRSSCLKEAHIIYKKMLLLFVEYVRNGNAKRCGDTIKKHLNNIREQIVKRIIQCIYTAYEHIHVIEIQKIKWINTQEMYEMLNLNQLSLFPELEETLYAYYELEIYCDDLKPDIKDLYELQALSPYRINSSIYNRLLSLRFKALLNRKIFEKIMYKIKDWAYKPCHPTHFYEKLFDILSKNQGLNANDNFLYNYLKEKSETKRILNVIEHLILDSIFCLQKFLEVVYPHNKTNLFTNGEIADIYKQLFEWSQLFDFLFLFYASQDNTYPENNKKNNKANDIKNKLLKFYENRIDANKNSLDLENKNFGNYKNSLNKYLNDKEIIKYEGKTKKLFEQLYLLIDKNNTHLIDCNYLAEMAIKKYQQAFSMHKEGKSYKSVMEDMYYLNDDLDNDTFKSSLALERYRINTGNLKNELKQLKEVYGNSQLFDIEKYINEDLIRKEDVLCSSK